MAGAAGRRKVRLPRGELGGICPMAETAGRLKVRLPRSEFHRSKIPLEAVAQVLDSERGRNYYVAAGLVFPAAEVAEVARFWRIADNPNF